MNDSNASAAAAHRARTCSPADRSAAATVRALLVDLPVGLLEVTMQLLALLAGHRLVGPAGMLRGAGARSGRKLLALDPGRAAARVTRVPLCERSRRAQQRQHHHSDNSAHMPLRGAAMEDFMP